MPRRLTTALVLVALAAAGCGDDDQSASTTTKATAEPTGTARNTFDAPAEGTAVEDPKLATVTPEDLPDISLDAEPGYFDDVEDMYSWERARLSVTSDEKALLTKLGFKDAAVVSFKANGGTTTGASLAQRYGSPAEAKKRLEADVKLLGKAKPVAGLPEGTIGLNRNGEFLARNVYFVVGDVEYFIGFGAEEGNEPGEAALIEAAKRIHARVTG